MHSIAEAMRQRRRASATKLMLTVCELSLSRDLRFPRRQSTDAMPACEEDDGASNGGTGVDKTADDDATGEGKLADNAVPALARVAPV